MPRRPHHALEPSEERGTPLTPDAISKQEFGRRLQKLLHERNWSQADLSRAVQQKTGTAMGRDAISTYINGRSYPTPKSQELLSKALGVTREDLFPNATINAVNDEHPAFEMKVAPGYPGRAWVRVNRMVSFDTAAEIVRLLNAEDQRGDAPAAE